MVAHARSDSVMELSGKAKTSSKSDNIFSPTNDHSQLISPSYDNKNSAFQASIENINVGGGAMGNAHVNQTPEVVISDFYNMLLQNQLYIQTLMQKQNLQTDTIQTAPKINSRQLATMARPRKVIQNKSRKDNYQSQMDCLFDTNNNISAPSELYSDVSSDKQS
ncbi:unnamed protein product [Mytilus coruscus]|uniref:Uncharacterized protein n=1 Tax=Mytilus coruscus TaxID=42192 RepID=A0A6J8D4P3_MYTCO|nr:unnamed protein product [Mytilus coruscus]